MRQGRSAATAAEKQHMGNVAALGCIVCSYCDGIRGTPAIVHHIRSGQGKKRAPHKWTIPLCPAHHQGSGVGVHDMGRQVFEQTYGVSEIGLLVEVFIALGLPIDPEVQELNRRFSDLTEKGVEKCKASKIFPSAVA